MSRKSKRVGKKIYDYTVLEKEVYNKRSRYKVKCDVCGNIKSVFNLNESSLTHSTDSCKEMFAKSIIGQIKDDYIIIDSYFDKRLKVKIQCQICNETRITDYRNIENNSYNHDINCILRSTKYDKKIINKICRTYSNCKTRIRKGNEGVPNYKAYQGKEFGFNSSLEMVYELYESLQELSQTYPLDVLTIDRIDNTRGYIPGNVRYITMKEQAFNKSTSYVYKCGDNTFYSSIDLASYLNITQQKVSRLFNNRDFFFYKNKFIRRYKRY